MERLNAMADIEGCAANWEVIRFHNDILDFRLLRICVPISSSEILVCGGRHGLMGGQGYKVDAYIYNVQTLTLRFEKKDIAIVDERFAKL